MTDDTAIAYSGSRNENTHTQGTAMNTVDWDTDPGYNALAIAQDPYLIPRVVIVEASTLYGKSFIRFSEGCTLSSNEPLQKLMDKATEAAKRNSITWYNTL